MSRICPAWFAGCLVGGDQSASVLGRVEAGQCDCSDWPGSGLGCVAVLVDEPVAGAVSLDRLTWSDRDDVSGVVGCSLVDSAVGSMCVVVLDVFLE